MRFSDIHAELANLPNISAKHSQTENKKCMDVKWSPILVLTIVLVA